ncbi:MAG TPA: SCO family protein [Anaerolineaceae bacterium]|nr:SCO family protein [Anaerolineaceae bacterium]
MKWIGLVVGLILGVSVFAFGAGLFGQPYTYHGSALDPAQPAPDFSLTDQHNQPFRLSDQKDKVVLVFFGYTSCPDVCPTTLSDFKRVRAQLGNQADQVEFVFITVDPKRDTPERILAFMQVFDPAIVGLTGSDAQLQPVMKAYGVYAQEQPGASAENYLVDHTARVYAIDRQGRLRLTYTFGTPFEDLLQDVQHLVKEG